MKEYDLILNEILNSRRNLRGLIEFFGMPGSGKSYISNKLNLDIRIYQNNLDSSLSSSFHTIDIYPDFRLKRIIHKLFIIFSLIFRNFKMIRIVLKIINLFNNLNYINKFKLIFNWLYICAIITKEKKTINYSSNKLLIMDQGLFQGLWSCFFYNENVTPDEEKLLKNFNNLQEQLDPFDLTVINVKTDINILYSRLAIRKNPGSSPINSLNKELFDKGFLSYKNVENFLKKYQKTYFLNSLEIKVIDNNEEI